MRKPYGRSERPADTRPRVGRPCNEGCPMMVTTGMALMLIIVAGLLGSCATAPASHEDKASLVAEATSSSHLYAAPSGSQYVILYEGTAYKLDVG